MSITTTSTLPAPVQQSFSYKLLSVPVPYLIHKIPAMRKNMPRNGGTTLRQRRYNPLNTSMVPLGNSGVNPPPQNLTAVDIDAKISFYGTYVELNEQVTLQNQDPVLNECAARLGVSLRQTEDSLTRDMLAATASFINATGGVNGDMPTEITRSDINTVVRTLVDNNAYMIMDNIEGDDKYGTAPIRDAFFALANSQIISDLDNVAGFTQKAQYPEPGRALRSEWGAVGNVRFLISSIGSVFPNASALGNTILNVFITGMESYCCIEQDGYSASFIYRPAIYSGPLAQNVSVGWKMAECPRLLNDLWIQNLRCTLAS
jgi:N4-gp56 family major capsid protein